MKPNPSGLSPRAYRCTLGHITQWSLLRQAQRVTLCTGVTLALPYSRPASGIWWSASVLQVPHLLHLRCEPFGLSCRAGEAHSSPNCVPLALGAGEVSSGFTALWECERLDLSVEAVVLKEQWRPLSTDEELCTARTRLVDVGYSVDNLIPRGYVRPSWRKLSRERLSLSRR